MLDTNERTQFSNSFPLGQWVQEVLKPAHGHIKVRLQGKSVHILWEASQCPEAKAVMVPLLEALATTNVNTLLPANHPPLSEIRVYGRITGPNYPEWTEVINLDRLDEDRQKGIAEPCTSSALVTVESLAATGNAEAIARYLSQTLGFMGVQVRAKIKPLRKVAQSPTAPSLPLYRRLYLVCESTYSPDASLMAPTIAQKLRNLELTGFRDAIVTSQVTGEAEPDWVLRVDLTPKEVMLKEWARWGDVAALSRLLNHIWEGHSIKGSAILKESTLHLFCTGRQTPDQAWVTSQVRDLLERLAPQGIYAVTLYGHLVDQSTPMWVDWLDLPAKFHPALAVSTLTLAEQGDRDALSFLFSRLLNPDLEQQLLTGGVRIQLVHREDLLHIMTEAPVCPAQSQIAPLIAKFVRQLKIAGVAGIRVYGRRAGQKLPRWNYGLDFAPRKRLVPEATPEFAASSAYVQDLMAPEASHNAPETLQAAFEQGLAQLVPTLQGGFIQAGLMVPAEGTEFWNDTPAVASAAKAQKSLATAGVWGILGLLLAIQVDWAVGTLLLKTPSVSQSAPISTPITRLIDFSGVLLNRADHDSEAFAQEGFIRKPAQSASEVRCQGEGEKCSIAPPSPYPSFNNRLLDDHLGRYYQQLQRSGPPDVLIVGSSRALRGINPSTLEAALAAKGYRDVQVYNFGINGATAQVVDLVLRRILSLEQLPKLILWADGTRAFNSGREDLTYQAIASSPGYTQLNAGMFNSPQVANATPGQREKFEDRLTAGYRYANQWLDQRVGKVSVVYSQRRQLQTQIGDILSTVIPSLSKPAAPNPELVEADMASGSVTPNGFLPLSIRFNPVTYYQTHPRVSGEYDRDYESFQLEGKQTESLKALVQTAQKRSIPVVFINMPLTQDYLDPIRTEYEEQFQRYMRNLALTQGFVFRDTTRLWQGTQYDLFSDPSHLNRFGADAIANYLISDPMIPWSILNYPISQP